MKLSIYEEVDELRKEIIKMKKMQKNFLDILDGLMKMVDYNNQASIRVIDKENASEDGERVELREYNIELIKVFENLKAMKKLEV